MFKRTKVIVHTLAEIPPEVIRKLVTEYITAIETGPTEVWCGCTWAVHPDDLRIKPGHCRVCNTKKDHSNTAIGHEWKGIRRRLMAPNLECPAHTKEGLLLGFIKWMEKK